MSTVLLATDASAKRSSLSRHLIFYWFVDNLFSFSSSLLFPFKSNFIDIHAKNFNGETLMATRMTAWPAPRQFVKSHLTENHLVENIYGRQNLWSNWWDYTTHHILCQSAKCQSVKCLSRCVSTKRKSVKCHSATSRGPRLLRGEKHKEHKRQF